MCSLTQWAPQSTYMNLLKANMKNHSCLFFFSVNGFQWKVFCNLYEGWWVYYSKLSTIGSEVSKENFIWSYYSMGERPEPSLIQNVLKRRTDYSLGAGAINWKSSRGCSRSGGIGEAKHMEFANTFLWLGQTLLIKVVSFSPERREEGVASSCVISLPKLPRSLWKAILSCKTRKRVKKKKFYIAKLKEGTFGYTCSKSKCAEEKEVRSPESERSMSTSIKLKEPKDPAGQCIGCTHSRSQCIFKVSTILVVCRLLIMPYLPARILTASILEYVFHSMEVCYITDDSRQQITNRL